MTIKTKQTLLAAAALALGGLSCAPPAGLVVDVDLGAFKRTAVEVRVTLHAPHGFMQEQAAATANTPGFTQMDVDGDGTRDLVIRFLTPFPAKEHILVATKNDAELAIHGEATAFDATQVIAGATQDAVLPAGGRQTLTLTLAAETPGPVGPSTHSTDLLTDTANVTLEGPATSGGLSSIAACSLDGTGKRNDLVIGVPNFDHDSARQQSGAVFVVFNVGPTAAVTLSPSDASQLTFYGDEAGDHLGASVACADLDADGFDDLIVGAPRAVGGAGRVYAIKGRLALNTHSVDVAPLATATSRPDATWGPAVATPDDKRPGFGNVVFAFDANGDHKAELLVAAPAFGKVHLLPAPAPAGTLTDVEQADHLVFTGLAATSLAAGDFDGGKTGVDVAIGDPAFLPANGVAARGAVFLFANVDPAAKTPLAATAATTTIVGDGSGFGTAALALDTSGRGQDLLVSAPSGRQGHGLVYVYAHDSDFFHAPMRDFETTTAKGTPIDLGDENRGFGAALGACASGSTDNPTFGLVVGAPETQRGTRTATGAAFVLAGGGGLSVLERLYGVGINDRLGAAVVCGDFDGNGVGDLATVAPAATGGGTGSGVAYVIDTHTK